jgi:2-phospho-L-lactate guanylyltransferase (CobY/MobA/RfbA family)
MSFLLIPIAPLSRTKSRLRDCFSKEQLKELTIAMFKDLGHTLSSVKCYEEKIVYCNGSEILELAADFGLKGIKEELTEPRKSFDEVISDLNTIAIQKFNAQKTVFTFLDTILISSQNFLEISSLIEKNQLVVCPAIHSAGISVLGRNPPDIIPTYFSDPTFPSFVALLKNAQQIGLERIAIYDSFRAGFDIDIKRDLLLAYQYLKILNLKDKETYKYLKQNLKLTLKKANINNNRNFKITKKQHSKFK